MKTSVQIKKIAFTGIVIILLSACSNSGNTKAYLGKVLNNLEKIESATYRTKDEAWAPGDTAASFISHHYIKEYNNPGDTAIGASFVKLLQEDTSQMTFCYDGNMRALVYEDEKAIVVDSFNVRKLPFMPVNPPFFNYAKSILKYALETCDSISWRVEEQDSTTYVCLNIFENRQVEFFGKACYMEDNLYTLGETTSKYEIWISKSTDLPYKVRREMSHDISVETVSDVHLNKIKVGSFKASGYFMPGYAIRKYGESNLNDKESTLFGKVAPGWTLPDVNGNTQSLTGMKSKVVMIQFTSVSCGPCRASIPFLKQLASGYKKEDFDFVALECSGRSLAALKIYQQRNDFSYKFLMSAKDVNKEYHVRSFPGFFILDKNRNIRKVIHGYGKDSTDREIRAVIDALILSALRPS